MPGAEVGLGESLYRPGQVTEGDAPVDHQALDLVEHREVPGVGRVQPEALAGMTAWIGSESSRTAPSIRWICTGEVWVRSSTVSGSPRSR